MGIDSVNKKFYERSDNVRIYVKQSTLWPEEQLIFEQYEAHIRGKPVLDVGCGGGRTTRFLNRLTQDYMGIDYSQKMVEVCQENINTQKFRHCDASDMRIFNDESFDFVLFSFNGIDCMSHGKRINALREIYRVLKQNGVFAFSTHNLDDRGHVAAYDIFDINVLNNIRNIRSYLKVRKYQVRTETYAIRSDPLGGYGHLVYFIRKTDQVKQLQDIGFGDIEIMDRKCQLVEIAAPSRDNHWHHFICQKGK